MDCLARTLSYIGKHLSTLYGTQRKVRHHICSAELSIYELMEQGSQCSRLMSGLNLNEFSIIGERFECNICILPFTSAIFVL